MKSDRVRAKSPVNEVNSWTEGIVRNIESTTDNRYCVTVESESKEHELNLDDALYNLFSGRLESEDPVGEKVWFKEK